MNEKLPLALYHYTTQEGLCGIIQQRKMWATEIRYLNDSQEFEYALAFTIEALQALRKKYPAEDRTFLDECERQLKQIRGSLADTGDIPIFVCSFSSRGNLLSQWRGYCGSNSGYSLGFDFEKVNAIAQYNNLALSQCLYHEADQMDKIKELIETNRTVYETRRDPAFTGPVGAHPGTVVAASSAFVSNFLRVAPTLKDPRFKEESEWRLTSFDPKGSYAMHFRGGKSTLIPYVEFPLTGEDGCFPLTKIFVGPTPLKELSKHSVRHLLRAGGIEGCEVQTSSIPYRSL
jgi:hypothetical protein